MHLLISDTVLHPCENHDEKEQDDSLCTRIPDLVPHECILVDLIHDKVCRTRGPSSGEDVNLAERLEGVDNEHNAHEEQEGGEKREGQVINSLQSFGKIDIHNGGEIGIGHG